MPLSQTFLALILLLLSKLEYFGKQKSSQYTVLVLDNRGVGNSDSPIGIYSSSEMAKDTLELLDHLEWTSNVNCVGSSMGGMIAQELALLSPHRFISLALISTHAGRTIPPFTALYKFPIYAFVPDSLQRLEILAGMLFSETKRNAPAPQGFVPQHLPVPKIKKGNEGCNADGNKTAFTMAHKLLDIMISRTKRTRPQPFLGAFGQFFAPMTHAVSPSRLRILKEQHHLEIMVVQRTWDNIFRTSNSPYIARHTGGKLVIVQGAGHEINTEEPELFNSLIEEFIHKRTNRGTKTEL